MLALLLAGPAVRQVASVALWHRSVSRAAENPRQRFDLIACLGLNGRLQETLHCENDVATDSNAAAALSGVAGQHVTGGYDDVPGNAIVARMPELKTDVTDLIAEFVGLIVLSDRKIGPVPAGLDRPFQVCPRGHLPGRTREVLGVAIRSVAVTDEQKLGDAKVLSQGIADAGRAFEGLCLDSICCPQDVRGFEVERLHGLAQRQEHRTVLVARFPGDDNPVVEWIAIVAIQEVVHRPCGLCDNFAVRTAYFAFCDLCLSLESLILLLARYGRDFGRGRDGRGERDRRHGRGGHECARRLGGRSGRRGGARGRQPLPDRPDQTADGQAQDGQADAD